MLTLFPRLVRIFSDGELVPTAIVKTTPYEPRKQASAVFVLAALTELIIEEQERATPATFSSQWRVVVQTGKGWALGSVTLTTEIPGCEEEGLKILIAACDEYVRRRQLAHPQGGSDNDQVTVENGEISYLDSKSKIDNVLQATLARKKDSNA